MDTSLSMALEPLAQGALLKLRDPQGRGVAVFSGSVWITQEGDLRDAIVEAGNSLRFDRNGLAVVQALEDTRLLLLDPFEASPPQRLRPNAVELHREARRQRSIAIGDCLLRMGAALRRTWARI